MMPENSARTPPGAHRKRRYPRPRPARRRHGAGARPVRHPAPSPARHVRPQRCKPASVARGASRAFPLPRPGQRRGAVSTSAPSPPERRGTRAGLRTPATGRPGRGRWRRCRFRPPRDRARRFRAAPPVELVWKPARMRAESPGRSRRPARGTPCGVGPRALLDDLGIAVHRIGPACAVRTSSWRSRSAPRCARSSTGRNRAAEATDIAEDVVAEVEVRGAASTIQSPRSPRPRAA